MRVVPTCDASFNWSGSLLTADNTVVGPLVGTTEVKVDTAVLVIGTEEVVIFDCTFPAIKLPVWPAGNLKLITSMIKNQLKFFY